MLDCSIQRVLAEGTALLNALAERTFRDAWQNDNAPEDFEVYCREHFTVEKMSAELDQPGTEFYFALINGQPAAYLKLNIDRLPNPPHWLDRPAAKAAQIERIYVLQDFQGQRVGEKLLCFSEERARQTGATWLWLSVWQKAPRTVAFYEWNGFEIFGVETFWLGNDPQPDWLMRKPMG